MKRNIFILCLFLVSCGPIPNTAPLPEVTTPSNVPTATTTVVPSATFTPTISPSQTPVLPIPTQIPCDPHTADYCITDGHFILQRPIQPPANDSVDGTYRYASTADGTRDPHHGVEIGNEFGTPVQAAAAGVVIFASPDKVAIYGPWPNFYGNVIVIRHADDLFTLYAHLSKINVAAGDTVKMGDKIGEVGQTGAATGSHLHFEVRQGDVEDYFSTVNPELWLFPARTDSGSLALSILDEASQFQRAKLTLDHYSDANEIIGSYYLDTYDSRMATGEENAAISDLPPGRYRITLIQNGYLFDRWVEVQSGKLTQVVIVVK
jgi:hypothetical protein